MIESFQHMNQTLDLISFNENIEDVTFWPAEFVKKMFVLSQFGSNKFRGIQSFITLWQF